MMKNTKEQNKIYYQEWINSLVKKAYEDKHKYDKRDFQDASVIQ